MRKLFPLLSLLLLLPSHAVSYDIFLSKSSATAYDNLMVSYFIDLGTQKELSYSIVLLGEGYNETIEEREVTSSYVNESKPFFTSNIPAGNYTLLLEFHTKDESGISRRTLVILPTPMLQLSRKEAEAIAFKNITSVHLTVRNVGNVPLQVSREVQGEGYFDVSPDSFSLNVNEEQEVKIEFQKPGNTTTFTITFFGDYDGMRTNQSLSVNVIVPYVNISFSEEVFNKTFLRVNLSNMGNIEQEVVFKVLYLSVEGVKEFSFNRTVSPYTKESFEKRLDIPRDSKVLSVSMLYLNEEGEWVEEKHEYGIFGLPVPTPFLNFFAWALRNETARGLLISAGVVVALFLGFKLVRTLVRRKK
ncbi:MAG TPA: hypothetical protein ENF51_01240 [Candidatus Aenigmarchaeota archaeon]|nr:hypothetical protein [Candidatus Aenigmarchaeota archaeon]